jgi:hypothetical protein
MDPVPTVGQHLNKEHCVHHKIQGQEMVNQGIVAIVAKASVLFMLITGFLLQVSEPVV